MYPRKQKFEYPAGSILGSLERMNAVLEEDTARLRQEARDAAYMGGAKAIADQRRGAVAKLYGELRQLTGDAGERLPEAYRTKRRGELLKAIDQVNGTAVAALQEWRRPLEQKARARITEGTPMTSVELQEVNMAISRFKGRTRLEQQRHLGGDAAEALRLGAHRRARVLGEAARQLDVLPGDVAHALDQLDPEKRRGQAELETVAGVGVRLGEAILSEKVEAGIATVEESVKLKLGRAALAHSAGE